MRVLVTRPRPDAERFAEELSALGHNAQVEPLFEVVFHADAKVDLTGVQALLFTSANGVRAFCSALAGHRPEDLSLQVFAVGDASARTAAEYGFTSIESAGGDVTDLTALVTRRLEPAAGGLFHAAGSKVAGDLKGGLEAAGFRFHRSVLYETREAAGLSAGLQAQLRHGEIDAVTFFSPRTAGSFVRLISAAGLEETLRTSLAVCLSAAVKERLEPLHWKSVLVAREPTQAAMLAVLDR
ncbi:uroporphyrinogen-III synthase [Pelagibius sp. Alg239-R121]|uniref:uroporphyrinogen-III synthase n=1 Tax=Pelagibius sp. Alg239-R121 TaxID=2993448 RepID=UPI0024A78932|nr:uroporphyrinogen-III synthase [Pelagibius sp. Alg239-R121]